MSANNRYFSERESAEAASSLSTACQHRILCAESQRSGHRSLAVLCETARRPLTLPPLWIRAFCGRLGFLLLAKLRSTHEADSASRLSRSQKPGDLLHRRQASNALVLIKRAFTDWKTDLPLDIEKSAEGLFLGLQEALNDVTSGARPAQRFSARGCSSLHSNRDHSLLSFLRSATALRFRCS